MKISLKPLFLITLTTLMFPVLGCSIGKVFIAFYIISLSATLGLILFLYPKKLWKHIKLLYKKTPYKFLCWYFIFAFATTAISLVTGNFLLSSFLTSVIGGAVCSVIFVITFVTFAFSRYFSINLFKRFIFLFCWIIFILSVIEVIAFHFDITPIKVLMNFLSSHGADLNSESEENIVRITTYGIPRARTIFLESSFFGYFIFLLSPIIYSLKYSPFKIFKNKFFNKFIKLTIIPLMWIALLLVQSPIFLLFTGIFTIFYYIKYRNLFAVLKKHIKLVLILGIPILLLLLNYILKIDLQNTFLNRIFLVASNINSLEDFIVVEPSLGTRLLIIISGFKIVLKSHFLGVGYGNLSHLVGYEIINSNLPLTYELEKLFFEDNNALASTILLKMFSETGFIGAILFYFFLFKTYKALSKIKKCIDKLNFDLVLGLQLFVGIYTFATVYDSNINQAWTWVIFSIIFTIILKFNLQKSGSDENNNT